MANFETAMNPLLQNDPVPLQLDNDGAIRVAGTRVTLDTVVTAFKSGLTSEQIVQDYPSLNLADVYVVIGFFLRHREDVEAYLKDRGIEADQTRHQIESQQDASEFRERLTKRRK